jgi:hypothetical protein
MIDDPQRAREHHQRLDSIATSLLHRPAINVRFATPTHVAADTMPLVRDHQLLS